MGSLLIKKKTVHIILSLFVWHYILPCRGFFIGTMSPFTLGCKSCISVWFLPSQTMSTDLLVRKHFFPHFCTETIATDWPTRWSLRLLCWRLDCSKWSSQKNEFKGLLFASKQIWLARKILSVESTCTHLELSHWFGNVADCLHFWGVKNTRAHKGIFM